MEANLEEIRKLPLVLHAERVLLTKEIDNRLGSDLSKIAHLNEKKLFVYKIVYKSQGHKVVGFIVEPRSVKGKLPCIIVNRGGSGEFGAIRLGQLFIDYSNITSLALNGYIVITTQYSGNSGGEGKDEMGGSDIEDVLNLYKIVKGYSKAESDRIGMHGYSRGGMMTYLSLARIKWLSAAVAVSAPSDAVNASKFRKGWEEHQKEMYGGSFEENKKRSALYWADKFYKKTPILIMAGTADWRVNPLDSIKLSEKLYEHKIPHRLVMFEGADHGITEFKTERDKFIIEWFDRFLKKGKIFLM
jgi:dipeptidyl aminopeptidase/acylaminoacyl peptidase